jgi:hypothetical protein
MHWALLTIKGNFAEEYNYFRNNTSLWDQLRKNNISYVSTLDNYSYSDMDIIEPLHEFLRYYYPFYREENQYQQPQNQLTSMIMRNLGSPAYMQFFFQELNVHGPDGPYAIVFTGNSVLVKYLGQGGWNDVEVGKYFKNQEVSPPLDWTQNYPKTHSKFFEETWQYDLNEETIYHSFEDSSISPAQPSKNELSKIEETEKSNRKFEEQFVFKGELEKLEWMLESHFASIPTEIIRLLETVRRERLEEGFKMLLQTTSIMGAYDAIRKKTHIATTPLPLISVRVDAHKPYEIRINHNELKFEPLQKVLYILFLKYPDGIKLSHLSDYKNTLLDIYLNISNFENTTTIKDSINRLCNPLENSLNEKISRINRTVYDFFHPLGIDPNSYRIIGKRGQPKMIMAAKDLVKWE